MARADRKLKFTLYKYAQVEPGKWRYCRAAVTKSGNRIKKDTVLVDGKEELHEEGRYYFSVDGQWTFAGNTAEEAMDQQTNRLAAQMYKRVTGVALLETLETPETPTPETPTPRGEGRKDRRRRLRDAADQYLGNCVATGKDPKTIASYRGAVDSFLAHFTEQTKKTFVEEVGRQDLLDWIGWMRRQPAPVRIHGNPRRTVANRAGHVAIFLKSLGLSRLLKKGDTPYSKKAVSAHSEAELEWLYSHADADQRFLLDFGLNSGFRDGEISHAEFEDLRGKVIEVRDKTHLDWHPKRYHMRKVTIPEWLADAIRARGTSGLIFPNSTGKPDQHLLRKLQALARGSGFHTELHKLRKTFATRLALLNMPLHRLQKLLGHESLKTTQDYLSDIELRDGETQKLVEAASYRLGPRLVAETRRSPITLRHRKMRKGTRPLAGWGVCTPKPPCPPDR